jgi:cellulase/cellobiase CelA1
LKDIYFINTGSYLNAWDVTWTMPDAQQITNLWNGDLNQNDNSVSVKNLDWNKIIPTVGKIKFVIISLMI